MINYHPRNDEVSVTVVNVESRLFPVVRTLQFYKRCQKLPVEFRLLHTCTRNVHTRIVARAQMRTLVAIVRGTVISLSHRRFVFALHQL